MKGEYDQAVDFSKDQSTSPMANKDSQPCSEEITNDVSSLADLPGCIYCGDQRLSVIQCLSCGDRMLDTVGLSPYERLQLTPAPLYAETEIQAVKERLLMIFHPLKASRLNSRWSLKQRALICRDAERLTSVSGALMTYAKEVLSSLSTEIEPHQESSPSDDQPAEQSCSENRLKEIMSCRRPLEVFLLESSISELREYDGYQERERLLNRVSRELLNRGRIIANFMISSQVKTLPLHRLISTISDLADMERWLTNQREALQERIIDDD